jgi:SAM-dependent methyltransferase
MQNANEIKEMVKEKYSLIALQSKEQNETSCCGAGCGCSTIDYSVISDDYTTLEGYIADADLGLGCGLPTEYANIKKGDTVVDLGSGAGNDAFIARSITGADGRVIGIDMTETMIALARENARKLNFENVEFRLGDIEQIPLSNNKADVVVSNCVLNLVPDKLRAFTEIYRILKPGGHFNISDIVLEGELPAQLVTEAEMYAGCISGAIQKSDYLDLIRQTGFTNIVVNKEKRISIPDEILSNYLNPEQLKLYAESNTGIFSITVYADKPKDCGCGTDCCH